MEKLKDKIIGIAMFAVCAFFSQQCTRTYLKGGDNKAISNYEKMLFDKSVVDAELYPEYKEITVKVMKVPIKTYEFRYYFELNGKKYEGQNTFQAELPKSDVIPVYYLKDDPNFNCVDPTSLLKTEKEKNSSNSDLYWGIGWGILGLLLLIGTFSKDEETVENKETINQTPKNI